MKRKNAVNPGKVIMKAMTGMTADHLVKKPRKTARIPLRLTQEDKDGIERMADSRGEIGTPLVTAEPSSDLT